jgi:hypothetical protein
MLSRYCASDNWAGAAAAPSSGAIKTGGPRMSDVVLGQARSHRSIGMKIVLDLIKVRRPTRHRYGATLAPAPLGGV